MLVTVWADRSMGQHSAVKTFRLNGCHLFVDGVLVGSQRADDLWGSEKWPTSIGAARTLLQAHFPTSK